MIGAVVYGFRAMRWEWLILLSAVIALDPSPYWGLAIPYLVFAGHEAVQGVAAGWMYWVFKRNAQREAEPAGEARPHGLDGALENGGLIPVCEQQEGAEAK